MEYVYICKIEVNFMEQIDLESVLQPGQEYILDYAQKFGKDIRAVKHDVATNTCFEKAELLGWNPGRVVKSVFLWGREGKFYGFVSPEQGPPCKPLRFDNPTIKYIFSEWPKKKRKTMMNLKNSISPISMEKGTCTPFVPDYFFSGDGFTGSLEKIYLRDYPKINKEIVDISIGGYGKDFHKISLHLPYEDIFGILNYYFKDKVEKVRF